MTAERLGTKPKKVKSEPASMGPRLVDRGEHWLDCLSGCCTAASMGPRLVDRGEYCAWRRQNGSWHRASMGPRLVDRGEASKKSKRRCLPGGLQWGRGWLTAERTRRRAALVFHFDASMGPRLVDRGEGGDSKATRRQRALQWGRGWLTAERYGCPVTGKMPRVASMGPRLVDRGERRIGRGPSRGRRRFNGAAVG